MMEKVVREIVALIVGSTKYLMENALGAAPFIHEFFLDYIMNDNENSQEKKLSIKFFNLGEAIKEVKDEFDYGTGADKVKSSAKLVGKTIFNAGLLAGKVGAAVIKHAPDVMARQAHKNIKNNPDMSNEDKEKHEKVIKYNEELKIKKQAKK